MKKIDVSLFLLVQLVPSILFSAVQESDLFMAASKGDLIRVKCLLSSQQYSVNSFNRDGFSPLMSAVWNTKIQNTKTAELLLEKRAEVNAASYNGHTSLMIASANRHELIVPKLLDLKADIHAANKQGWTAFNRAAWNGNLRIAATLLSAQADINQVDANGKKARALADEKGHAEIISLIDSHERALCIKELTYLYNEQALAHLLAEFWQPKEKE